MSIDVNILKAVEANLVSDMLNNDRDYNHFHPSEWDNCSRKNAYHYYEAKGFLEVSKNAIKTDPQLQRIFDVGHWMHDRWRSYLERLGCLRGRWLCQNFMSHLQPKIYGLDDRWGCFRPDKCDCGSTRFEYKEVGFVDSETMWTGHVDAILDVGQLQNKKAEEDLIVIDLKSINPFEFNKLTAPKNTHMTQMQIYLYLSGLPIGKFLYENKGNQSVKEFLVPRDDSFIEIKKAEAIRLKYIVEHVNQDEKRVLPQRAHEKKGHTECLGCKFRANCWST